MTKKTNKETIVDINNTDAIMEELKTIALEHPQERKVKNHKKGKTKENEVIETKKDTKENIIEIKDEKDIEIKEAIEEPKKEEIEENENKVIENIKTEITENLNETKTLEEVETSTEKEKSEDDLSFIEEIKNTKEENIYDKEKPKRKTYEQMFGYTWMGHGITD